MALARAQSVRSHAMETQKALGLLARGLVACLVIHFGSSIAAANIVLFNNYVQPGYQHNPSAGWSIDGIEGLAFAMSFTPSVDARLESLTLSLESISGLENAFDVTVHEDSGGLPGADLESFHLVDTFPQYGTNPPPTIIDSVLNPILSAGSQYWLSIQGGPLSRGGWDLALASPHVGTIAWLGFEAPSWTIYPFAEPQSVYRVEGAPVPEPGTLALFGGGLLALLRRRQQG
jgi:PEP-CTERM motif